MGFFRNGRNQAIRIPRELEVSGDEGILRKEGDRLILELIRKGKLLALLKKLKPIETEFPDTDVDLHDMDDVDFQ